LRGDYGKVSKRTMKGITSSNDESASNHDANGMTEKLMKQA
jgi:hypothetical protein